MNLSAATQMIFIIAIVIALIAVLAGFGILAFLPVPAVWIMAVAFMVLAAGNMLKGI